MKHNWSQFTHKSDRRYEDALTTGETESLKTHNILDDGQLEIEFIQDVITAYFGNKLSGGAALDICCGAGYMSRCLRDFNFQTTGIELNEHAVKLAQRLDPAGQYIVSDVTELPTGVTSQRFDLILIREAHPLSRVADEIFHKKLISQYLELLSPGGFMVIAHARNGGGMSYPSISYNMLGKFLKTKKLDYAGPLFMFCYKNLGMRSRNRLILKLQSTLSYLISRLTNQRFIEFFILQRGKQSNIQPPNPQKQ